VRNQTHRPLLLSPDPLTKIRHLLAEREPFYRLADVLVSTELRSLKEVVHHVVHQFRLARGHASHP
jgi:shikimate kinase